MNRTQTVIAIALVLGSLSATARAEALPEELIEANKEGCISTWSWSAARRLRVLDRGPGIAAADQSRLFRRFVRLGAGESNPGSSGLGLAIARQAAEQMGGRLWYEDRPGGGAQFALELPLHA